MNKYDKELLKIEREFSILKDEFKKINMREDFIAESFAKLSEMALIIAERNNDEKGADELFLFILNVYKELNMSYQE